MKAPLVSVICPVFNAEPYLCRCVDSILTQTFEDFELLLIDDGSTDSSGKICDDYAAHDSRIRVFHKENGGVSHTRQFGLDYALGDYSIHIDPDDWAEPIMLETLVGKAKETDADMVICDFIKEYKEKPSVYVKQNLPSLDSHTVLKQLLSQRLHGSCWNKLVRRSCFEKYKIRFPEEVSLWEDLWVSCLLCCQNIKIEYVSTALYHYDCGINANSIVRSRMKRNIEDQKTFCNYFSQLFQGNEELTDCLAESKISTKLPMFRSMSYGPDEIINTFPDVNDRIVKQFGRKADLRNILPYCLSLAIRSKHLYPLSRLLYILLDEHIKKLYQKSKKNRM